MFLFQDWKLSFVDGAERLLKALRDWINELSGGALIEHHGSLSVVALGWVEHFEAEISDR